MKKFIPLLQLIGLSLIISTLAHGSYLLEWSRDRFMVGFGDGLAQILPFKKHLYDQYTAGEFFYSSLFGLGSGTYSGLGYYFSTSVVFLVTVIVFYLLETLGIIPHPDLLFWAHAAVFISIARLTAVMAIAHLVFRYMKLGRIPAFLGAAVYGLSDMYFRHAVFWEFFADAYLWLPLLVFGAEKIWREDKPGWFILAVAISMIDNFYFAYVNFMLLGFYLLFRFFMPLEENEIKRKKALLMFLVSGLIGAGISTVSFIPAAYAFFNNHRPPYLQEIPWFDLSDNILFTSRFIILPPIIVLLLFAFPLYRDRRFRFFAVLVITGIVLHYSPMMASVFNGFSAPRYRWEYFLAFAAGGAAAFGISHLSLLKKSHIIIAGLFAAFVYTSFALADERFNEGVSVFLIIMGMALLSFILFARLALHNSRAEQTVLCTGIVILLILFVNGYQQVMLAVTEDLKNVTEEFITGPDYDDPEIRRLLAQIKEQERDSFYRIDWMEGLRNNTSLVQEFRGVSAYSSILNKQLLHFYLYELEIDMGRESISRYATLGKRSNLHSLLKADYIILNHDNRNVPYGFEQILSSENYGVYENQYRLPFVRAAGDAFSKEELENEPVLRREHAMLSGVILKNPETSAPLPPAPEEHSFTIREAQASYKDGVLKVVGETGGIDLVLTDPVSPESDLYVSFHLENRAPGDGFPLTVNSYRTTRKPNASLYRTYVDDLTIRVPAEETIRIRMPEGTYELTELTVLEEPYELLRREAVSETAMNQAEWDGSRIRAEHYNGSGADYLVMPVPYERGWQAEVNGEKTEVLEANYAFIAVPAEEGANRIELTYRPPYFFTSLSVSFFSVLLAVAYLRRQRGKAVHEK